MKRAIRSFAQDRSGATAIEYSIIAGGIAVVIVGAVNAVGGDVTNLFGTVSTKLGQAGNPGR